jgi:hypothetical protein
LYVLGIIQHEEVFCDIPNLGSVPNFPLIFRDILPFVILLLFTKNKSDPFPILFSTFLLASFFFRHTLL